MDIYQKLAAYLNTLPSGFPAAESGVELKMLKRLYTPEEAALFLHLTLIPETAKVVALRAQLDPEITAKRLEEMVQKGLIYSLYPKGKPPKYQAFHYVCGIWEFQVNMLNPEFAEEMGAYWPVFFSDKEWSDAPQMRIIPINKTVTVNHEVFSYEEAEKFITDQQIISVSNCICRQEEGFKGRKCARPEETCIQFGPIAEFYIHRGAARQINRDEALQVLKLANEHRLVLQPSNSKEPGFICCCCSCCCAVLRCIKRYDNPSEIVHSAYIARVNEKDCTGCEACIDRCQMDAIEMSNGVASVVAKRCIGCGLCSTTCSTEAIRLYRKPEKQIKKTPKTWEQSLIQLTKNRHMLNIFSMLGMLLRSKRDRLRAWWS